MDTIQMCDDRKPLSPAEHNRKLLYSLSGPSTSPDALRDAPRNAPLPEKPFPQMPDTANVECVSENHTRHKLFLVPDTSHHAQA